MATATIEAPIITIIEETPIVTIEAMPSAVPDTCDLCEKPPVTECEACEKQLCKKHTESYEGWCIVKRTFCPECYTLKLAGRL